jgi:hypothetical protein
MDNKLAPGTVRIEFTAHPGEAVLSAVVHRYHVPDELQKLLAWGCRIVRLTAEPV